MPGESQRRGVVLWGRDHQSLGEIAVEQLVPSVAVALSPGRFPKGYPHVDRNEDSVLAANGGGVSVLAVVDGHNGVDAAEAALQATLGQVPILLSWAQETPERALLKCFDVAFEAVAVATKGLKGERAASATALTVGIVVGRRLTVAGLGDSRAVVIRGARVRRVGSAGPFLGCGVARREVAVDGVRLRWGDWVVVASDGLFEFLGRGWARRLALLASQADAAGLARGAVQAAFEGGAGDNVAVAVAAI